MGSNKTKRARHDRAAAEQMLIDGLIQHAATFGAAVIDGVRVTTAEMIAQLQERIDAAHAVESTRAAWLQALKVEEDERARTKQYVSGVRQALMVAFGRQIDTLAEFGLTPPALHVRTPEEKLAVTAKGKATRLARHTMGPRQKAKITGTVAEAAAGEASSPTDQSSITTG